MEAKDPDLSKNNYIIEGITKKEHMEKPDNGFGIYMDPTKPAGEVHVEGKGIRNKYEGRMFIINVQPGSS